MADPAQPPPHSADVEESLLACCLLDSGSSIQRCLEAQIGPAYFYEPANRTMFELLCEMYRAGRPADDVVLAEELRKRDLLASVGGIARLDEITDRTPTTVHREYYIEELRAKETARVSIERAQRGIEIARRHKGTAAELAAEFAATVLPAPRPEPKTARPFTLWAPSQFVAFKADPSSRLVEGGVVEAGAWTSLVGIGGLGKTRLAMGLCIAQQTGREWCGLKTSGVPQRALILSTENGIQRWHDDFTKALGNLTGEEREIVEANTRVLALTDDEDGDLCLGSAGVAERISVTLTQWVPGIVVFDPFADMIDGDESKTLDMVATLSRLRTIMRSTVPQAAVVIVHHARTGASNVAQAGDNFSAGNFSRGSKALVSKVRCEIQLAPADKDDPNRLVFACGKCNNGPRFATRGLIFDPETFQYSVDPDFDVNAWREDVAGKRRGTAVAVADVVAVVREQYRLGSDVPTGAIVEPLREQTGASAKTIQRRLSDAATSGYLRAGRTRGTWRLGLKPLPR